MPLFKKFLPRLPVIEILAKSQLGDKNQGRMFSFNNDETGYKRYLSYIKNLGTFLISDKLCPQLKTFKNCW